MPAGRARIVALALAAAALSCAGGTGRADDPWDEEPLSDPEPEPPAPTEPRVGGAEGPPTEVEPEPGDPGETACTAALAQAEDVGRRECVTVGPNRVVTLVLDDSGDDPGADLPLHVALVDGASVVSQESRNWVEDFPRPMRRALGEAVETEMTVELVELGGRSVVRLDYEATYARGEEPDHLAVFTALYEVGGGRVRHLWSGVTDDVRDGLVETCRRRTTVEPDIEGSRLLLRTRTGSCASLGRERVRRIALPSD